MYEGTPLLLHETGRQGLLAWSVLLLIVFGTDCQPTVHLFGNHWVWLFITPLKLTVTPTAVIYENT